MRRSHATTILLAVLALFCARMDTRGQTHATPAAAPQDFGKGFAYFFKLGLPEIPTNAQYVALQANLPGAQYSYNSAFGELNMSDRAWMLPGEDGADRRQFVSVLGHRLEVMDNKAYQKMWQEAQKEQMANTNSVATPLDPMTLMNGAIFGSWKDADMSKDVTMILNSISGKPVLSA
jgi:hypothetical protein